MLPVGGAVIDLARALSHLLSAMLAYLQQKASAAAVHFPFEGLLLPTSQALGVRKPCRNL